MGVFWSLKTGFLEWETSNDAEGGVDDRSGRSVEKVSVSIFRDGVEVVVVGTTFVIEGGGCSVSGCPDSSSVEIIRWLNKQLSLGVSMTTVYQ